MKGASLAVGPVSLMAFLAYGTLLVCRDGKCFESANTAQPSKAQQARAEAAAAVLQPSRVVVQICNS